MEGKRFSKYEREIISNLSMITGLSFLQAKDFMEGLAIMSVLQIIEKKAIDIPHLGKIKLANNLNTCNFTLHPYLQSNIESIQNKSKLSVELLLQKKINRIFKELLTSKL